MCCRFLDFTMMYYSPSARGVQVVESTLVLSDATYKTSVASSQTVTTEPARWVKLTQRRTAGFRRCDPQME